MMKKTLILAISTLLSTSAFASIETSYEENSFHTDAFENKASAYNAGFDIADQFGDMNRTQLQRKLNIFGNSPVENITIDGTKVTIEEFAESRNKIAYRAKVNVSFHYDYHESND